ncbi:flavin reductase family protein [Alkalihalobacillus oceani]|uniref:Flavin reductase family protein n=1 Tax=Halalkalibacter oceani TaxID=1653776 RepID=A0A9X2DWJ3_9BACI|nr:flavin reductase family protein [Halalkalibacter oceani]MCM3716548.1 flavin reductase family protein [Halalkalibacter oceani]
MLSIDPAGNSEKDNYKLLTGGVVPRPIAFVTTRSPKGTVNGAPFSFFNVVSSSPPRISLSIQRMAGKQKDTARNIEAVGEFVVHLVDQQNVGQVNQTAVSLPSDQSEIELAKLTPVNSVKLAVPGVKEAKMRLECVLEHRLELEGEAGTTGCDFIIGKVVHFHIAEEIYENGRIDPHGLGAVSRLAGHDYAKIGEMFSLKRPQ